MGRSKGGKGGGDELDRNKDEDFMKVCHDDTKFGGKSISSPIKSIEVRVIWI